MSFIVEQAGGMISDGRQRTLDIQPDNLHQRSPVFMGSESEVGNFLSNYLQGVG